MHFDARDDRLAGVRQSDDFDVVLDLDDAALHASGRDGAAPGDGEDVLDGHQEGLVGGAFGGGDVRVDRVEQFPDLVHPGVLATLGLGVALQGFEGLQRAAADDRHVVTGEFVAAEQFADFHLDEFEEFFVVDHVDLVEEHDDVGHADLTGEQDVLAGLGHGAVGGAAHQDGSVHLGGTGDHVLDVVGVAGAVDVAVVAGGGVVFDVGGVDGDAAGLFFGGLVDLVVGELFDGGVGGGGGEGDRGREGGLAVVDVTDGADVHVRLRAFERTLRHNNPPHENAARVSRGPIRPTSGARGRD